MSQHLTEIQFKEEQYKQCILGQADGMQNFDTNIKRDPHPPNQGEKNNNTTTTTTTTKLKRKKVPIQDRGLNSVQ